jgi:hypothetical protein
MVKFGFGEERGKKHVDRLTNLSVCLHSISIGGSQLNFQFLIFDRVEELDLVGSWELVGLLQKLKKYAYHEDISSSY